MINKVIVEKLNMQINAELSSAYLYLAMSHFCKSNSLNGFAGWLEMQAQEELLHAKKIWDYLISQDAQVVLMDIAKPKGKYQTPVEIFESALENEKLVTKLLTELAVLSAEHKDFATSNFLQWFINEQIEEEASVRDIVGSLKLVGDRGEGLLILDRELAGRTKVL